MELGDDPPCVFRRIRFSEFSKTVHGQPQLWDIRSEPENSPRTAWRGDFGHNLITDRDSGRSKGFGFVEMGSAEEAHKAKRALDGSQLDGRALKVDAAREQVPRAPRSGGVFGGGYHSGGDRW